MTLTVRCLVLTDSAGDWCACSGYRSALTLRGECVSCWADAIAGWYCTNCTNRLRSWCGNSYGRSCVLNTAVSWRRNSVSGNADGITRNPVTHPHCWSRDPVTRNTHRVIDSRSCHAITGNTNGISHCRSRYSVTRNTNGVARNTNGISNSRGCNSVTRNTDSNSNCWSSNAITRSNDSNGGSGNPHGCWCDNSVGGGGYCANCSTTCREDRSTSEGGGCRCGDRRSTHHATDSHTDGSGSPSVGRPTCNSYVR